MRNFRVEGTATVATSISFPSSRRLAHGYVCALRLSTDARKETALLHSSAIMWTAIAPTSLS